MSDPLDELQERFAALQRRLSARHEVYTVPTWAVFRGDVDDLDPGTEDAT